MINYNIINIILYIILITVNMPSLTIGSFFGSLGFSVVNFAVGLLLGLFVLGIFMFLYNILKPENKIEITRKMRITAGLLCAILLKLFKLFG